MKTGKEQLEGLAERLTEPEEEAASAPRARPARAPWLAWIAGALLVIALVIAARDTLRPEPWTTEAGTLLVWALERDLYQGLVADMGAVLADYDRACEDGYRMACDWLEVRGPDRPRLDQATAFFAPRCDVDGEPVACLAAGWTRSQRGPGGRPDRSSPDPRMAAAGLEAACSSGLVRACIELGRLAEAGVGMERDPARAIALQEQACADGHPYGCALHGDLLVRVAEPQQPGRGREVLESACTAEPRACALLGGIELRAATDGPPPEDALTRLRLACDGGSTRGCLSLGTAIDRTGRADRFERSLAAWGKACGGGEPEGCYRQAWSLELGRGVPRQPERARQLFERACRMGFELGCGR